MSLIPSQPGAEDPFFIIGAQRSGTTFLYELLDEHPDVAMAKPKRPEPKWFLDPQKAVQSGQAWNESLFQGASARLRGEKGTSYLEHPEVADAILRVFPGARFIAILREPSARAVSNYRFSVENGSESLPIGEALTPEAEKRHYDPKKFSVSPYSYLRRGLYADYLAPWTDRVTSSRLHVMVLEELLAGRGAFDQVCRFLRIDPFEPKGMSRIVNAAVEPIPEMSEGLKANLREYFREPNSRLKQFLGRPLELWGSL